MVTSLIEADLAYKKGVLARRDGHYVYLNLGIKPNYCRINMYTHSETTPNGQESIVKLYHFLDKSDVSYKNAIKDIPLFNTELTKNWTYEQKQYFVRLFYHIRGNFHNFLWHMGNYAPNVNAKKIILQNIEEEFGLSGRSHEQLYFDFAASLGVDLNKEIASQQNYLPFIHEFNKGHMEWLRTHDWEENLAIFSAYERLDNVDYVNLYNFGESLALTKKDLLFFTAHIHVKHFSATEQLLCDIWISSPHKITAGFNFISKHQEMMWRNLSDEVFKDPEHV